MRIVELNSIILFFLSTSVKLYRARFCGLSHLPTPFARCQTEMVHKSIDSTLPLRQNGNILNQRERPT